MILRSCIQGLPAEGAWFGPRVFKRAEGWARWISRGAVIPAVEPRFARSAPWERDQPKTNGLSQVPYKGYGSGRCQSAPHSAWSPRTRGIDGGLHQVTAGPTPVGTCAHVAVSCAVRLCVCDERGGSGKVKHRAGADSKVGREGGGNRRWGRDRGRRRWGERWSCVKRWRAAAVVDRTSSMMWGSSRWHRRRRRGPASGLAG